MTMFNFKTALIRYSPLVLGLACLGCRAPAAADPGAKCGHCDYRFAQQTPNPCDPCVPYVELPCYGYTPTCWQMFPEECAVCPPVHQPGLERLPEDIMAPPSVNPASHDHRSGMPANSRQPSNNIATHKITSPTSSRAAQPVARTQQPPTQSPIATGRAMATDHGRALATDQTMALATNEAAAIAKDQPEVSPYAHEPTAKNSRTESSQTAINQPAAPPVRAAVAPARSLPAAVADLSMVGAPTLVPMTTLEAVISQPSVLASTSQTAAVVPALTSEISTVKLDGPAVGPSAAADIQSLAAQAVEPTVKANTTLVVKSESPSVHATVIRVKAQAVSSPTIENRVEPVVKPASTLVIRSEPMPAIRR